jgi:hypothetical protein
MRSDAQGTLPFRQDPHAELAWANLLDAIRLAVGELGGIKELAYQVDSSPSLVSDALAERDRKRVAAEWLVTIILRAPEPAALALLQRLADLRGCEVSRRRALTAEEKLERLQEMLRQRFGAAGAALALEVDR